MKSLSDMIRYYTVKHPFLSSCLPASLVKHHLILDAMNPSVRVQVTRYFLILQVELVVPGCTSRTSVLEDDAGWKEQSGARPPKIIQNQTYQRMCHSLAC